MVARSEYKEAVSSEIQHKVRIVVESRLGDGQSFTESGLGVVIMTDRRIDPDVDANGVCEVGAVLGQLGVGRDQLAEDCLGAVKIRKGTIGIADFPGELRIATN